MRPAPRAPHEADRLPTVADYARPVRRHARLLVVLLVLGALAGLLTYRTTPVRHTASSSVALAPRLVHVPVDPDTMREREVTLDTSAALVRSDAVVAEIARTSGGSPAQVRAGLSLSARPSSRVLVIGFTADSAQAAEAGSHAAVEALLAVQRQVLALSDSQVGLLRNRVNLISAQAQERTDEGLDASALYDVLTVLEDRLQRTLESARTASTVVRRTQVRRYRTGRPEVFVVTGLAGGLLLGLALARLLDRRSPSLSAVDAPRHPNPGRWLPA